MLDGPPAPDCPDGELVRYIAGATDHARAAEQLIHDRYAMRIRLYGLRHLGEADAAADLVQHVLLSVIEAARAGRVREPDRLGAFVMGACRFAIWDARRAERRGRRAVEQASIIRAHEIETGIHPIDRLRLEHCIDHLPPRDVAVVRMTFNEDRAAQDIAGLLGVTAGNVRVIRHRALAQLRACLEGREGAA
jgi:RNA polymerase sigma-70 factor, ECF subfamily